MPCRRFIIFIFLILAAGCGREKSPVLARVDSAPITADDFIREMTAAPANNAYLQTPAGKKELLELLIRRRMVLAEAEKSSVAKSTGMRTQLDELNAEFLRQRNEARERLLMGEFLRHLRGGPLAVTDEEVKASWGTEQEVKASHILVSDETLANDLKTQMDEGATFETLAKEHSEDPTGKKGGDLGFLMRGSLDRAFEDALFGLKTGEVSDPVTSPYGFHLIKKTGERALSGRPLAELERPLRAMLENQKFQTWLEETRKRHTISTDAAALESVGTASPAVQ